MLHDVRRYSDFLQWQDSPLLYSLPGWSAELFLIQHMAKMNATAAEGANLSVCILRKATHETSKE